MTVYADFKEFSHKKHEKAVYTSNKEGGCIEGHSIVLLGWGESADEGPYWIAQNTWGPGWADRGCFKIRRGTNECAIEQGVVVGSVDTSPFTPIGDTLLADVINAALDDGVRKPLDDRPTTMPLGYGGKVGFCEIQRGTRPRS